MSVVVFTQQSQIIKDLIEAAIIPANCTDWSLEAKAHSVLVMRTEVIVSTEQFEKIARVLMDNSAESKSARETIVRSFDGKVLTA